MMLLSTVLIAAYLSSVWAERGKYNFNPGWKLIVDDPDDAEKPDFDDSDWANVSLPHAWNEDEAFAVAIANLSTDIAWYRKTFDLPKEAQKQKVFIEFEGIRQAGEFYVNGDWVGRSENGVMAFGFDVTDFISADQDNLIAARIDNSWDYHEKETGEKFQWQDKNFYANYGGINKNVFLHTTDPLHQTLPLYRNLNTTGAYVYAQNINIDEKTADITAETQVANSHSDVRTFSYSVVILNADGKTALELDGGKHELKAGEMDLISVSGQLSNINFWSWGYGYLYDVITSLSVDGEVVDVVTTRTGFRKTEFQDGHFKLNGRTLQVKGYGQRTTNEWPGLGSAVPAWLSDFSNQIMLDSNANLVRWMHVTPWKQDVESADRLGLLQSMPAGDSEGDVDGVRWQQRLDLMRDAIIYNRNNPSIIFYESGNHGVQENHMQDMKDLRDQHDPHGGRASGSREMLNSTVAEYGGEMLYINKGGPGQKPFWAMEYSRDEGARKYWDEFSPPYHKDGEGDGDGPEYNRNQDSHAIEDVMRWNDYFEARPGTGERVSSGGVNIIFSDTQTHCRGNENFRRSGEVDAVRLPKDGFHAHRVMWDGWVDVEKHAAHIIGHWNYQDDVVKNVSVVSTADKVQLFLNGESLGMGERNSTFLFTFADVEYAPGKLEAIGYDADGNQIASDIRTTTGESTALRLTAHVSPGKGSFKADGSDIALVNVEVVDADGRRVPTALNEVNFELSGEATWRGGIAIGPEHNYILSKKLPVEGGVNRVLLRSTTTAGNVTLRAEAEGLESAELSLNTTKMEVSGGLSRQFPSAGLPASLARGPTPNGESFMIKRTALVAEKVEAGSGQDNATLSIDDNEVTAWSGESGAAKISYLLAKESEVTQVVTKFGRFSRDDYTVSVYVDGEEVWAGTTDVNLGYFTFNLVAAKGRNVTLEATEGGLEIIELEIYGPA